MGTRVQFNPSTLKALFNPVTKKVLAYPCICALCDSVPFEIKVTFTGVQDITTCCNYDTDSRIYDGGAAAQINGEHILKCAKNVQSSCCWEKLITGSFGDFDYHAGADCGYFLFSGTLTAIRIAVLVYETGGTKYTEVGAGYGVLTPSYKPAAFFHDTRTFVNAADCLNLGNTFTNEAACGRYESGENGTAVITLP